MEEKKQLYIDIRVDVRHERFSTRSQGSADIELSVPDGMASKLPLEEFMQAALTEALEQLVNIEADERMGAG